MTPPISHQLYFLLHSPTSGMTRVGEPARSQALGAALLCELLGEGAISLHNGMISLHGSEPQDPWLRGFKSELREFTMVHGLVPIARLIRETQDQAAATVKNRLLSSGEALIQQRRRLGRANHTVTSIAPERITVAHERLSAYLRNSVPPSSSSVVAVNLAMRADPRLSPLTLTRQALTYLDGLTRQLAPPLLHVLNAVESTHSTLTRTA